VRFEQTAVAIDTVDERQLRSTEPDPRTHQFLPRDLIQRESLEGSLDDGGLRDVLSVDIGVGLKS